MKSPTRWPALPIVILILVGAAVAQSPVARITQLTGVVTRRHADKWSLVNKTPADLFDGDKVSTDRGRTTVVFLGDNTTVVLDVGTNITIRQSEHPAATGWVRRVEVFVGDLWFKVTKGPTQHTSFVTPTAVGGVRGTEGAVHVDNENESSFTLNEGELEVAPRDAEGNPAPDAEPLQVHGGESVKTNRGATFKAVAGAILALRPDVGVVANLLPQLDPERWSHLSASERPDMKAILDAAKALSDATKKLPRFKIPRP